MPANIRQVIFITSLHFVQNYIMMGLDNILLESYFPMVNSKMLTLVAARDEAIGVESKVSWNISSLTYFLYLTLFPQAFKKGSPYKMTILKATSCPGS